jgi:hypothetical protein
MKSLHRLLEVPGSRLARALRCALAGLRSSLQEATRQEADDPWAAACRDLVADLDDLLSGAPPPGWPAAPPLPPAGPAAGARPALPLPAAVPVTLAPPEAERPGGLRLGLLREEMLADATLRKHAGPLALAGERDEALWNQAQRLFLRLPASLAQQWRQKARQRAREAGAEEDMDPAAADVLPLSREEIVYPGLKGAVQARGLWGSPSAALPPALPAVPPGSDLLLLAGAVSVGHYFIDHDPALHHALKAVNAFGVVPLSGREQKARVTNHLLRRFQAAVAAEGGPLPELLRARLDLDEVLHSLVYNPPADLESSWWAKLHVEWRRPLAQAADRLAQAGPAVTVRSLHGPYADVLPMTGGPGHDLEVDGAGPPGHVAACLRVFARIDREVLPGRVLYFPATIRP